MQRLGPNAREAVSRAKDASQLLDHLSSMQETWGQFLAMHKQVDGAPL